MDGGVLVWLHSPRLAVTVIPSRGKGFLFCRRESSLGAEGELPVTQTALYQLKSRKMEIQSECFKNEFSEFTSCAYQFVDGANPNLVCFHLQSDIFLPLDTLNCDTSSLWYDLSMVGFIAGKTFLHLNQNKFPATFYMWLLNCLHHLEQEAPSYWWSRYMIYMLHFSPS